MTVTEAVLQKALSDRREAIEERDRLREACRAVVSDAWYREGEDVCTLPTRNLIRLRAVLDRLSPEKP